jgi:hypothetical protein
LAQIQEWLTSSCLNKLTFRNRASYI